MKQIHLYFRVKPSPDRFLPGDRYIKLWIKKLSGRNRHSGIRKVFLNLCKGFDQLKVNYDINLPFEKLKPGEPIIVLGDGRYSLFGYQLYYPIIAGIGLMTHPNEWPGLFYEYPVLTYLQHSQWTKNIYAKIYGDDKCDIWPAGVDTNKWAPSLAKGIQQYDVLIYNKIMWDKARTETELKEPIIKLLIRENISYKEVTYGQYNEKEYFSLLKSSKSMIFLCEHESQGLGLCEALSMNIPVFAWDQGLWLDPQRFSWGENDPVLATSIPFFDENCGMRFNDLKSFENTFQLFISRVQQNQFKPRDYVLANLTLEKSAQKMLEIIGKVYK